MRPSLVLALFMSALLNSPALGNPPSPPPPLYAICPESGCLYMVDLTGIPDCVEEIGELGPPGRFPACTSMAMDGETTYTVNNTTGELLTINRYTGEARVVATGVGQQDALAINPSDVPGPGDTTIPAGTLFGATDQLVTIDRTTGEVTVIGPIGLRIAGLAFRPHVYAAGATLFGAESGSENRLVTISTRTGTVLGAIGLDVDRIGSLALRRHGGGRGGPSYTLWGSDAGAGTIFTIDLETAEIRGRIELPGGYRPEGMVFAYAPAPVEPSSWGAIKSLYR
jgi:hypothetical protein